MSNTERKRFSTGHYAGNKWGGKYLRAPDIFYTILKKGRGKLTKLGDIAKIRFGIKTGADEFFYLDDKAQRDWNIEKEFLRAVIKSPKECDTLVINPEKLPFKLFLCNKSKSELKGTNALKYITWGEEQTVEIKQGGDKGKKVRGYQNISTIKARKEWYNLGKVDFPQLIFPCGIRENFKVFVNNEVLINKRLYEIYYDSRPIAQLACILNSSLFFFLIELFCRSYGGGGGPIDATVEEVENILIIKPTLIKKCSLPKRQIKTIFEECGLDPSKPIREQEPKPLPDRAELDNIIFDELGLTKDERKEVYWAVCELVKQRLDKAKSLEKD